MVVGYEFNMRTIPAPIQSVKQYASIEKPILELVGAEARVDERSSYKLEATVRLHRPLPASSKTIYVNRSLTLGLELHLMNDKKTNVRDSVFFSYCREDHQWLSELKASLATLGGEVRLNMWDDSRISPASEWRREIDEALSTAAAAVLLLSPQFFQSEFINNYELPPLMDAARRGELKLFPVIISPCQPDEITAVFQAVNDPAQPVATLTDAERGSVGNMCWNK